MTRARRFVTTFAAFCISFASFAQTAQAGGLISTEQVATSQGVRTAAADRAQVLAALERAEVSAALAERGVSPDQARARVAALTDAEARQLAAEIDKAPAGASELIGTLILVFVILLFTDILGYTHIFPFVKQPAQ
jgi:hypothetical protein